MDKFYKEFWDNGFVHVKSFFNPPEIKGLLAETQSIFERVFQKYGYEPGPLKPSSNYFRLFQEHRSEVINCGKQAQHGVSLHGLGIHPQVLGLLKSIGITSPVISTRPVLFFNHPSLASAEHYWKTPTHQDWRTMQGSTDSIVMWVPLVDVPKELGALEIIPKSHKLGLLPVGSESAGDFQIVDGFTDDQFIPVETNLGDALFFSSFLVHRSGTNVSNQIRWSCHFRYNNLDCPDFLKRGFPHAYVYHPVKELIDPEFNTEEAIRSHIKR